MVELERVIDEPVPRPRPSASGSDSAFDRSPPPVARVHDRRRLAFALPSGRIPVRRSGRVIVVVGALLASACSSTGGATQGVTASPPGAVGAGPQAEGGGPAPKAGIPSTDRAQASVPLSGGVPRDTVTPAGGTVSGPDGASLTVPPGAVTRATPAYVSRVDNGYDVHIEGGFSGSVLVAIPVGSRNADDIPLLLHYTRDGLVVEDAQIVGKFLVADVTSLSVFDTLKCVRPPRSAAFKCLAKAGVKVLPNFVAKKFAGLFQCGDIYNDGPISVLFLDGACKAGESEEDLARAREELARQERAAATTKQTTPPPTSAPAVTSPPPTVSRPVPTSSPGTTAATSPPPSSARGFTVTDDFLGGTWARTDTSNGTWHRQANRPPNGKYWFSNGLGVGVDCMRAGAQYQVSNFGKSETWTWWAHVTDNTWVPAAALKETSVDGPQGLPSC